ncbi:MAG TPA: SDR family oxidoreductase [Aggregatilineales bacterium]|nr:SDR family oxidoreductase [Anaerolineales bacterium]HRE47363.1 SDR family oxidoreductase [Aggregatilineales bacterium]
MKRFEGKKVIIIGASGGLGGAYARAFAAEGARLTLAARTPTTLIDLAKEIGGSVATVDLTNGEGLNSLRDQVVKTEGQIDVVVNATGFSPRKRLELLTDEEIQRTLNTNLLGAILVTRTFAPDMRRAGGGVIAHMGGYADGRLAFPFFSADVATRAGIMSFSEAVNREYRGTGVTVLFFSPSPAETEAEKPFHPMWRKLGQPVVPVEKVAAALLNAVAKKKKIHIMGGLLPVVFSRLNDIYPRLTEVAMINRYRGILARFLDK